MKHILAVSGLLVLLGACAPSGLGLASATRTNIDCATLRDDFGIDTPEEAINEGRQDCADELSGQELATLVSERTE